VFLGATSLFAQQGTITGTVIDNDGGETLPGANVYLESSITTGTVTDIDGQFVLTAVPVGSQVLVVSYAGFAKQEIPVEVTDGDPLELEVVMAPAAIMGEEVIVTAQALGQAKAINQQLNSDAIANFVSADKIKELPDVNAAEAISRLPGVAINRSGGEGSKVVVRGLDPKFTAISINGVRLPATSGTDRSVDLSLISPELLSGIELFKSPTPDMDGDALGGSINLNIIKAPKEKKASLKAMGGYNGLAESYSDYKFTGSYSQRLFDGKLGISLNANTERFVRDGNIVSIGWGDDQDIILDTLNNVFEQEGNSVGYNIRQESRTRQNGSLGVDFALGSRTETTVLGIYSRTGRDQFSQQESYSVAGNGMSFTPTVAESSIQLFSGSISTRHTLDKLQIEWGAARSEILGETPLDFRTQFFAVTNPFPDDLAPDKNRRTRPWDFDRFVTRDSTREYLQRGRIRESSNQETINSAFVDFSVPFKLGEKIAVTFKTGGKIRSSLRERQFDEFTNEFGLYLTRNSTFAELGTIPAIGVTEDPNFYYSAHNFTINEVTPVARHDGSESSLFSTFNESQLLKFKSLFEDTDLFRKNRFQEVNDYTLEENVYSYYGMLKFKFGNKLTVIPGARVEISDNFYTGIYADLVNDLGDGDLITQEVDVNYTNVLPHLHVKYQVNNWLDIRTSYSTTLARPDYNYVVPFTSIQRTSDLAINQGNPFLEASQSENLDLYVTAYKGKLGLFSVGAFQKNITDAFYPFQIGLNDSNLVKQYGFPNDGRFGDALLSTFDNTPESFVQGLEFDLQSSLNFLPGFLSGFVLNVNYSFLRSETTINGFTQEIEVTPNPNPRRPPTIRRIVNPVQRKTDLIGQASQIFNGSLGYDYKGLSTRFSAAYQGNKISGYSAIADKDRFNKGFWRFDAVVKYRFTPAFNVFLNLNNLSNQQDISFFREERLVTNIQTFGTTATIGAQYTFFKNPKPL